MNLDLDLTNRALLSIGQNDLIPDDEKYQTLNFKLSKQYYLSTLLGALTEVDWTGGKAWAWLCKTRIRYAGKYKYVYDLPIDCAKVLVLESGHDYIVEGRYLTTDDFPARIQYITNGKRLYPQWAVHDSVSLAAYSANEKEKNYVVNGGHPFIPVNKDIDGGNSALQTTIFNSNNTYSVTPDYIVSGGIGFKGGDQLFINGQLWASVRIAAVGDPPDKYVTPSGMIKSLDSLNIFPDKVWGQIKENPVKFEFTGPDGKPRSHLIIQVKTNASYSSGYEILPLQAKQMYDQICGNNTKNIQGAANEVYPEYNRIEYEPKFMEYIEKRFASNMAIKVTNDKQIKQMALQEAMLVKEEADSASRSAAAHPVVPTKWYGDALGIERI